MMPRKARAKSGLGIYHVMLRGVNGKRLFHDEDDFRFFTAALRGYREPCGFRLFAWCLMPTHVHLLIGEGPQGEPLSQVMQRLGAKYAYYYNLRYERAGPLFQGRFRSEAIQDDGHFLTALRFIHRNPLKAGLASRPEEYRHSSWRSYLQDAPDRLTDTGFALSLRGRAALIQWHQGGDGDACLDEASLRLRTGVTDDKCLREMRKAMDAADAEAFQRLPGDRQEKAILRLRRAGASLRQICRLTGTGMARVRKIVSK